MSNSRDESEKRFWNNYLALLAEHQIKSDTYSGYVQHCEQFIRTYTEIRLKHHTQTTVTEYLSSLLQQPHRQPWQKAQAFDALKFLFLSIRSPLVHQIDWEYWKMSSKELEHNHATVARNNYPVKKHDDNLPVKATQHNADIEKLIYVIRSKGYSIRTEKTYLHWVNRFLTFNASYNRVC